MHCAARAPARQSHGRHAGRRNIGPRPLYSRPFPASFSRHASTRRPQMIPFRPEAACPLDGIVVLDLSRLVAGNMLSLQLADFGAEVIKVEDPAKGDPLRDWRVEGHSLFWKAYARNKKSLTLDLRKEQGKGLLLRLVERAQVL